MSSDGLIFEVLMTGDRVLEGLHLPHDSCDQPRTGKYTVHQWWLVGLSDGDSGRLNFMKAVIHTFPPQGMSLFPTADLKGYHW